MIQAVMKKKKMFQSVLHQVIAIGMGLLIIAPIIYAVSISLMPPDQVLSLPPKFFPTKLTLENYKTAIESTTIGRYMINSLIMAGVSSVVRIILASLSAFAFSFFKFRGRNLLFFLCLGTIMIPSDIVIVTNYKTVSSLQLIDTYLGMMIVFFCSALNIFMMRQHFMTFSKSLKEASYVDGCGNFRFFLQILVPTATPVMSTIFISSFISTWNTYLWPMLVTNQNDMRTVQAGVTMLNFAEGNVHGPIMAASVLVLIPTLLIFIFFQKKIVSGMMGGAIKE